MAQPEDVDVMLRLVRALEPLLGEHQEIVLILTNLDTNKTQTASTLPHEMFVHFMREVLVRNFSEDAQLDKPFEAPFRPGRKPVKPH